METETTGKDILLGKTLEELRLVAEDCGMPGYASKQINGWLYNKHVTSISEMTDLSKISRERLSQKYDVGCCEPVDVAEDKDGTRKYLFPARNGGFVETVFLPEGKRAAVCISSQVGCKMHCAFCLTGRGGFKSQLSAAEILNQLYSLPERDKLTNIVLMGQGEPLDNYDNVMRAYEILTGKDGFGFSPRRITLSTCGVLPKLKRLVAESEMNIAISLHSPFHEERMEIMPAERAFPINDVVAFLKTCEEFRDTYGVTERETSHQRKLSFEYVLLKGKNDTPKHISALKHLLKGLDCRMNVIPFHSYHGCLFQSPTQEEAMAFCQELERNGIRATMRRSRGKSISAACGMLAARRSKSAYQK